MRAAVGLIAGGTACLATGLAIPELWATPSVFAAQAAKLPPTRCLRAGDALHAFQLLLALSKMAFRRGLGRDDAHLVQQDAADCGAGLAMQAGSSHCVGGLLACCSAPVTCPTGRLGVLCVWNYILCLKCETPLTPLHPAPNPWCSQLRELHAAAREKEDPELQVGCCYMLCHAVHAALQLQFRAALLALFHTACYACCGLWGN